MPTLKVDGTIAFPLGDEGTPPSRPFSYELSYSERNVGDLVFSGAVTDEDIMGKIADAKAVFIECLSGGGTLKANGGTGIPLAPGVGNFQWYNSSGGLSSLTLTTTGAASFRLSMFS